MKKLLLVMLFTMFPVLAHGATYYVAKTGSDSNSCSNAQSQSQPKLTINAGVGCLNAAGDTLVVKSGVYDEILNNVIPSGSPGNPVTVKSEVQYGAIIRPATFGSTAYIISIMNGAHDIVLDGLVVDGINQTAVPYIGIALFTGSHDITIKNAEIMNGVDWHEGSSDFGLWVDFDTYNLLISHNKIHDFGGPSSTWFAPTRAYGIYYHAYNSIVEYNDIYNNSGYGIHMYQCCSSPNGGNNNIFRGNIIHDNGATGLLFAAGGANNTAYNNIIYNNGSVDADAKDGIQVGGVGTPSSDNALYNNTIYNNTRYSILLGSPSKGPSNTVVKNNILYGNGTNSIGQSNDSGSVLDRNLVGIDPLFVNAAGADFHLQANSPAIDAGVVIPGLSYNGSAPDLGALEAGAGRQLPTPTNLRLVGN